MNIFGKAIRVYLIQNDLKQQVISDRMGTTKSTISAILNRDNITLERMISIANALDCDMEIKLIPKKEDNDKE